MDKDTIWREIMTLAKYYNAQDRSSAEVLNLYVEHLRDMDYEVFKLAIDRHVETNKFMPTIADIRQAAMENVMRKAGVPSPAEAWGEVSSHLADDHQENFGTLTPVNRLSDHEWSHPIIKQAVEQIGWKDLYWIYKSGDASGWMSNRARFMDAYRDLVAKLKTHYSLTPDLRQAIDPPDQPMLANPDIETTPELTPDETQAFGYNGFANMQKAAQEKFQQLKEKMEATKR